MFLRLTTDRFRGGAAPKSDVAQAQTQLDTTPVQLTDIAVQRAQFEHAIATLIGKPPAAFSLPRRPLDLRPPDIPVGLLSRFSSGARTSRPPSAGWRKPTSRSASRAPRSIRP